MAAPPNQCDPELAYLRGHMAGLERSSENPAPPQVATHLVHHAARPEALTEVVGGTTAAPQATPLRAAKPRDYRRPLAPAEVPRTPPAPVNRRSPP